MTVTAKGAVLNQLVAPIIIKTLGLDPDALEAAGKEQISVLPFLIERRSITRFPATDQFQFI